MNHDVRATRAADWWERNCDNYDPDRVFFSDGFDIWSDGMDLTPQEDLELFEDYCSIIHERRLYRGMTRPVKDEAA